MQYYYARYLPYPLNFALIESKPGSCPAVAQDGGLFGVCASLCEHDFQCAGYNEKCCPNECGGTVCKAAGK